MPKIKSGEVISWDEFFKRWKQGISQITPLQQTRMSLRSTWIVVIGIICGIGIAAFNYKTLWWLLIILLGALGNTIVIQYGTWQKYLALKRIDDILKEEELKGGTPTYV